MHGRPRARNPAARLGSSSGPHGTEAGREPRSAARGRCCGPLGRLPALGWDGRTGRRGGHAHDGGHAVLPGERDEALHRHGDTAVVGAGSCVAGRTYGGVPARRVGGRASRTERRGPDGRDHGSPPAGPRHRAAGVPGDPAARREVALRLRCRGRRREMERKGDRRLGPGAWEARVPASAIRRAPSHDQVFGHELPASNRDHSSGDGRVAPGSVR